MASTRIEIENTCISCIVLFEATELEPDVVNYFDMEHALWIFGIIVNDITIFDIYCGEVIHLVLQIDERSFIVYEITISNIYIIIIQHLKHDFFIQNVIVKV